MSCFAGIYKEAADAGIEKVEEFCERHIANINHLLSLQDSEMEKQNIPQEKRSEIRENIKEFIRDIDLEEIAQACEFDESKLGEALAARYQETYEQDEEYDYIYHQRMLYSLTNYALETIKNSKGFERERILDCYRLLLELQKHKEQDKAWEQDDKEWKKSVINILKDILKHFQPDGSQTKIPHIITDSPAQVDRNTFMKQNNADDIYEKIKETQNILLVNGLGGVGKTAVAKALFHMVKNEYDHIGWIEYNGTLKNSILNSCTLYEDKIDPEERYRLIYSFFNNDAKKILFIDNVDKTETEDRLLRDITGTNMTIVVTSRINRIPPYDRYKIAFLSEEECIRLFYAHCEHVENGESEDTVRLLVKMVRCHTLSVELLAKSYTPRTTLKGYYEQLKTKGFAYPRLRVDTEHAEDAHTIAEHLKILFNLQELNEEQVRILSNFTLMPRINISGAVCDWIQADDNEMEYLVRKGWLSVESGAYYMHPIIRETILLQKSSIPKEFGKEFLSCIDNGEYFTDDENYVNTLYKLDIAESFVINLSDDTCFDEYPNVHFKIALINDRHGRYEKALEYYEKSLEIQKKMYGEEHPSVAISYNNIGLVYDTHGVYGKALEYYEKSLEIRKKVHGEEHPSIATSYNNIGLAYRAKGVYEKALEYHEKALKIQKKAYGEEHPSVAISYNNIGFVYDTRGVYEKALEYYEKSLEIRKKVHGEEHPSIATSYNNIGLAYRAKGVYEKALEYHEKALKIQKKAYGEEHPSVATSYNNIGLIYRLKGSYEKALECYKKSLEAFVKTYGEEHPPVATSYNNIGVVYYSKGSYEKALEYHEKSLGIRKKKYGQEHPDVATSYNNIGDVYRAKEVYEKALECYEKALKILKEMYGEEHPYINVIYENIKSMKKETVTNWTC